MTHHDEVTDLMAENGRLRAELAQWINAAILAGCVVRSLRAAARQDAEEKARLKEALVLARKEISDHDSDYHHRTRDSTVEAIRTALIRTPTGVPIRVQQSEEIARLRSVMQWIETKALLAYQGKADKTEIVSAINNYARAALACRPQGERGET